MDIIKAINDSNIIIERDISYNKDRSNSQILDIYYLKDKPRSPRPAIVFIHGGSWKEGDKANTLLIEHSIKYAKKGYVCFSVNYRLSPEAPFPAAVHDVKCAVRWIKAHAKAFSINPDLIGTMGNSAGGHLVSMLALTSEIPDFEGDGEWKNFSSDIHAAVNICGPTDFTVKITKDISDQADAIDSFLYGPEDTFENRKKAASPFIYIKNQAPPFLVIHGTADKTVPVSQSDRFVSELKKTKTNDITYLKIKDAPHRVYTEFSDITYTATECFFQRTLGL